MTNLRVDIVSIGTLSRNLLWGEEKPTRTPHATSTLIRTAGRTLLIDPGLFGAALQARLHERTGLKPADIDTVFLTSYRPSHRQGLDLFAHAELYLHPVEQEAAFTENRRIIGELPRGDADRQRLEREQQILKRCKPAPDELAPGVSLFPLHGPTPGHCGLIVATPAQTIVVAGDAVPSYDHFLAGQVLPENADLAAAKQAMQDVYDVADVIIPGHDNLFTAPRSYGM
ncbi:MAG: MBL fold metallo-hydrolase [Phycisphaerae bacterium]